MSGYLVMHELSSRSANLLADVSYEIGRSGAGQAKDQHELLFQWP
jgi:hypothetical protein